MVEVDSWYPWAAEEGKEFYKTIIERVIHKESE